MLRMREPHSVSAQVGPEGEALKAIDQLAPQRRSDRAQPAKRQVPGGLQHGWPPVPVGHSTSCAAPAEHGIP